MRKMSASAQATRSRTSLFLCSSSQSSPRLEERCAVSECVCAARQGRSFKHKDARTSLATALGCATDDKPHLSWPHRPHRRHHHIFLVSRSQPVDGEAARQQRARRRAQRDRWGDYLEALDEVSVGELIVQESLLKRSLPGVAAARDRPLHWRSAPSRPYSAVRAARLEDANGGRQPGAGLVETGKHDTLVPLVIRVSRFASRARRKGWRATKATYSPTLRM